MQVNFNAKNKKTPLFYIYITMKDQPYKANKLQHYGHVLTPQPEEL